MNTLSFVSVHVIRQATTGWEFLQIHRAPGRFMENTWQLVSGGIEPNEPAWQAALRELHEETALTPLELYTLDQTTTFYIPHNDTLATALPFCAIVPPTAQVILNHEHTAHRWLPAPEIAHHLTWPAQRATAREVIEEIIHNGPSKPFAKIPLPPP